MKRYDNYKDSGVQWIGEIPSHWKEFRLKYLLSRSAAGVWGDDEKEDENDIVCFRIADFDYGHGILKFDNITYRNIQKSQLEGRQLSQGDLLIEKSGGGDAAPVGRVVRFNYDGEATCSNFIHSISVKETSSSNFLYYFFYSLYANKENLLYFNQTTGIQNLKVGEYLSQSIFLPELGEQKAIAEWLDAKCGEIDKLIATQQQRIELLQELRQSIITRAVTRGINPDVPLRDSGIDWIGQLPAHWEIRKTSLIYNNIGSGTTPTSSNPNYYTEDGDGFYWLQTGDLNDGDITSTSKQVTKLAVKECNLKFFPEESVVIAMYGATIGKVGLLKIRTATNQACCVLPHSKLVLPKFSFYLYQAAKTPMLVEAIGGGQPNISQDIIKKLRVPLPPLAEQREIVTHIERETAKVDHALQQAERQIELLQELRQSVITEVVTGKRKVC